MRNLTTDEIRALREKMRALTYDIDSYQNLLLEENQTAYYKHFKRILSECVEDTISELYSIIKDTDKGGNPYGSL